MKNFVKFVERYAPVILLVTIIGTIAMLPGIKKIRIARGLDNGSIPAFNSLVKSVEEVRKTFQTDMRQVIISIEAECPHCKITDSHVLDLIAKITGALKNSPSIKRDSLLSLTSAKDIVNTAEGLGSEKLVAAVPRDEAETKALERKLRLNPFYYGRLISKDFKSSLILATAYDTVDLTQIHKEVDAIISPLRDAVPGIRLTVVGDPEINYQLSASIEHDVLIFVALAVLIILASFWAIFRTWKGVLLPLCGILIGIIWTMGLMGYYGEPILIISATIPVVIVVIGAEYCIHVYHLLSEQVAKGESFRKALAQAVSRIFAPMAVATTTTFVGGVSLMTFKIRPIQHFGIFMGVGTVILIVVALLIIPALFKVLHRPAEKLEKSVADLAKVTLDTVNIVPGVKTVSGAVTGAIVGGIKGGIEGAHFGSFMDRALVRLSRAVIKHSYLILTAVPLVLILSIQNARKIEIGFDNVSMLPDASPIKGVTHRLDKAFGGTQQFEVLLDTKATGKALDPAFLHKVAKFEKDALGIESVSHTFSVVHILKKMHAILDSESKSDLPLSREAVAQYVFLLSMSSNGMPISSLLADENQKLRVNVTVGVHDTQAADHIYGQLERLARNSFGDDINVKIGGDLVHSIALTRYLVWGKIQNILIVVLAIFLLVVMLQRSIVRGFLTIFSLPVGCFLNFGVMGLAGIRLDFVTAIITSVAMGMGVDYFIHFIAAVKEAYRKSRDMDKALSTAIQTTGRVMLYSGFCTTAGFSALWLSDFQAIHVFATLMCFTLVSLLMLSLIVLPAAIRVVQPEFITNHRRIHRIHERKTQFAMKLAFSTLIAVVLSFGIYWADAKAASQPSADDLILKAKQNVYTTSEESVYVMRLVSADGKEAIRKMKVWFRRDSSDKARLLIKFQEPAEIRGTGMLNLLERGNKSDQWLYLPALKKVRRIKGGNDDESFLGSDFTTGDLNLDPKQDYSYKITSLEKPCGAAKCYELTGVPGPSGGAYSKKVLLIRKDNDMVLRTEYYSQGGQLEKVMSLDGIHQDGGNHWLANKMEMKNLLSNHTTVVEVEKRDTSKAPAESFFTQSNLERN
jgi:predicted RND superfamily exporter protein